LLARHGNIELMDDTMSVYRVHSGGIWSSMSSITQVRETARMLRALDRHFGFQYSNAIGEGIASRYLDLALTARHDGRRIETGKHLASCIRNGGLRLSGSLRTFTGLAAFTIIGSRYKLFSRAKTATRA